MQINYKINIATLNTYGIENNQAYVNYLAKENSILCLQVTWTNQEGIRKSLYIEEKKIYSISARKTNRLGRPKGGLAFIVDNGLECSVKLENDRIGIMKIHNLILINMYMIYGGSSENELEFELDIKKN